MRNPIPTDELISTAPTTKVACLRPCETRVLSGRYRVRRLIGHGGMSDVYLGDDLLLERTVAIKMLHRNLAEDSSGLERFRREAMTLAAVRSPHVVGIYDIALERDAVYLVMQHIEGHTIEQEIARTGPMPPARVEMMLVQILDGLAEMHSQGLVHRDIKPSNVLVDGNNHVVLLDLGIVRDMRRMPLTAPGMVAGTPGYLAPESRVRAESEVTSDIYQVGLLMLFLLTGVDSAQRQKKGFEDLLERLPPALEAIARRALANEPVERFPSAAMMKDAVEAARESPAESDRDNGVPTKLERARTARSEPQPLAQAQANQRATTEITAAQLLTLLSDARPTNPSTPARAQRGIKTTALQAAQILSARPSGHLLAPAPPRLKLLPAAPRTKVLLVDQDAAFCASLHRMLTSAHDVFVATNASSALDAIGAGNRFTVILCGLMMPRSFHDELMTKYPDQAAAIVFLMTGAGTSEARSLLSTIKNKTLGKPFEMSLLKKLISEQIATTRR